MHINPFVKHSGISRTRNAGILRSFSVVLIFLPLICAHTVRGDTNSDLLEAAGAGNTATVEQLLEQGADINAKDHDGTTPLITAARMGTPKR